jgi:hypothetical protein
MQSCTLLGMMRANCRAPGGRLAKQASKAPATKKSLLKCPPISFRYSYSCILLQLYSSQRFFSHSPSPHPSPTPLLGLLPLPGRATASRTTSDESGVEVAPRRVEQQGTVPHHLLAGRHLAPSPSTPDSDDEWGRYIGRCAAGMPTAQQSHDDRPRAPSGPSPPSPGTLRRQSGAEEIFRRPCRLVLNRGAWAAEA